MGIASLILGILSLLISFTWFADLSLILGVLALVLGIIAIVKKNGKGMGIAAVILSVLAIIILFSADTDDTTTGTGINVDTGSGMQSVEVSTEKISFEKVGITKYGDFVIKVTNNNDGAVCLSTISTIFKDKDGVFVEKEEATSSFVCIPSKSSVIVYNSGYDKAYSKYENFEFSCELANIAEDFIYSGIHITSKNTGKQIAVTLANNSGQQISSCEVMAVYYKDNKVVGIEEGYSSDTTNTGSNCYINVDYAVDKNYNNVSFDKYEVYYINASTY